MVIITLEIVCGTPLHGPVSPGQLQQAVNKTDSWFRLYSISGPFVCVQSYKE
ncbi:uncharacterized protein ANIA_11628 [Aspergillus nidulans FGSC A4]|uniref:Uncharacterized protein n=1 Tax=Emericella nidulans (strain FGSC A4 / ATCC 38163 / CBS 112.46 / NRRL 194 / M139) TaxID=227321 RepID=C8VA51_EMENI|nr:hypothetical protein [Aspergillus nidulans FGSC A4]CBF78215.1 TPA: hypothetical protein ANIA_11628 [Aspergillus nidulans FGSC A4]